MIDDQRATETTGADGLAPVTPLDRWRTRAPDVPASEAGIGVGPTPWSGRDMGVDEPVELPSRRAAFEAAEARLLARLRRGDRSREELRRELAAEGELDEVGIDAVLDRLGDLGYIDDARMAEQLADRLSDRKGLGLAGLRRALRERLLDDIAISQALADRDRDDEFARAAELATARAERMRGLEHDTAMRRLMGFLQRRGYSQGVAMIAAGEALTGDGRSAGAGHGVYFGNTGDEVR